MKNFITIYINGIEHNISGEDVFMPLANFIRYKKSQTGTKIVCAEGDCGACTILVKKLDGKERYYSINSCIGQVFQFHGHHIITVEGLQYQDKLHPVQESMINNHGAQCGYCTPGIVSSLALLAEEAKRKKFEITDQKVKNFLTGNLCRCTGYAPIIKAGKSIELNKVKRLDEQYPIKKNSLKESVGLETQNKIAFLPTTIVEAIDFKDTFPDCRIVSGATDVGVLKNKRGLDLMRVLHLGLIKEFSEIKSTKSEISIGACARLEDIEDAVEKHFPEFSKLLHIFASPQIKGAATLVGNVANGSPIGDTIPFLMVANARLELISVDGIREVNLNDFYKGYKTFDLKKNELISKIIIPKTNDQFKLFKVSLRKDLDISAVTFAARYVIKDYKIQKFSLALGGVAATVIRLPEVEMMLEGQLIDDTLIKRSAEKVRELINPLSDVRGSKKFRKQLCHNLLIKCLREVKS